MEDVFFAIGRPALRSMVGELLRLAGETEGQLRAEKSEDISAIIAAFHLKKLVDTARGALLLFDAGLPEQAQALVRVMLEVWVNFDFFASECAIQPNYACRRFWDAVLLQKATQMRESEYAGIKEDLRAAFDEIENEIIERIGTDEAKKLRKHGLSGMTFEQRAEETGHKSQYQILYRNFSRNIHGADIVDTCVARGAEDMHRELMRARHRVAIGLLVDSIALTGAGLAHNFDLPLQDKWQDLQLRIKDNTSARTANS